MRFQPRHLLSLVAVILILASFVVPYGNPQAPVVRGFTLADEQFSSWFGILAVFAFLLGGASLVRSHGRKVKERARDWRYSLVTLVSFFAVLILASSARRAPGCRAT